MKEESKEQQEHFPLDLNIFGSKVKTTLDGPLQAKGSKTLVEKYKQAIHQHLLQIIAIDRTVYEQVEQILSEKGNYTLKTKEDKEKIESRVSWVLTLLKDTGQWPHEHLSSLADLIDHSKTHVFPFSILKQGARMILAELCEICRGVHDCSNLYIDSLINEQFLLWDVPIMKSRTNLDFSA